MSKFKEIKNRIVSCMKSGDSETRDILKTLIGELQAKAIKEKIEEISDSMVDKTVKSFKDNAEDCLSNFENDKVKREISIYEELLPKYEGVDEIIERLSGHVDALRAAKSTGPATGMAMGVLKSLGCNVLGKDVSLAVEKIRERR